MPLNMPSLRTLAASVLLLSTGVAVGQRLNSSKYDKYFKPATLTQMDIATLEANLNSLREAIPADDNHFVPVVTFDTKEKTFKGFMGVSYRVESQPIEEIRKMIQLQYSLLYESLKSSVPELSEDDFMLTVYTPDD
jgi:hypothetical protein